MQYPIAMLYMALLTLSTITSHSQSRQAVKPLLFSVLPAKINCTEAQLSKLFIASKGEHINLVLNDGHSFSGPVVSQLAKFSNLRTMIIKLPAFDNTLFSLSQQTDKNNNHIYVGRILNPLYADGFELKHNARGTYQLIKINAERILVNCNQ